MIVGSQVVNWLVARLQVSRSVNRSVGKRGIEKGTNTNDKNLRDGRDFDFLMLSKEKALKRLYTRKLKGLNLKGMQSKQKINRFNSLFETCRENGKNFLKIRGNF